MFPIVGGLRSLELGFPGDQRTRLNTLVLRRAKRATAGLLADYDYAREPVEQIGEKLALVDDEMRQVATLLVTGSVVLRFADVPWEFADAEGEGFTSIEEWREAHLRYWTRKGHTVSPDSEVVCLSFEVTPP
jgi:uncharacterized protein YhfF